MNPLPLTHPQSLAITRIRAFFDSWSLPGILQEADTIFSIAASEEAWRPPNPWDALHCCRQLQQLGKAAHVLAGDFNEQLTRCIIATPGKQGPNLHRPDDFKSSSPFASLFSDMPRHLTADEYRYPIKALHDYCRYRRKKQWKQFYRLLAQCALSSTSLQAYEQAGRLFTLRAHIFKLVEACHLIQVRLRNSSICICPQANTADAAAGHTI